MTKKGRTVSGGELSLWQKVVQGIRPWHEENPEPTVQAAIPIKQAIKKRAVQTAVQSSEPSTPINDIKTLDGKTDRKLSQGKLPIEATLDLHGMTQTQAHQALDGFVMRSYQSGKRCILVITGKGSRDQDDDGFLSERRERGVLRSRLPDWLAMAPFNDIVLKHVSAHRKHGGDGAFYIYLKNSRKS